MPDHHSALPISVLTPEKSGDITHVQVLAYAAAAACAHQIMSCVNNSANGLSAQKLALAASAPHTGGASQELPLPSSEPS